MKRIALTIFFSIIFFGGAYLMGNYAYNSFDGNFMTQFKGMVFGIMLWCLIGVFSLIIAGIYVATKPSKKKTS
jgi:hypothetical protein